MKEKCLRMLRRAFAGTAILTILVPVRAQVSNPSTWSDFVKGSANPLVVDTFRRQDFLQLPTDNWSYVTKNKAEVPAGKRTMKIPMRGEVSFEPFQTEKYANVEIKFSLAGDSLVLTETLKAHYLSDGQEKTKTLYTPTKKDDYFQYREIRIDNSPSSLTLQAAQPGNATLGGHYLVNSFSAFGSIPLYSLFEGAGSWNDTVRWSHLPPLRERSALVNGKVALDTDIQCRSAHISNGSLHIAENGSFSVDELYLHNTDNALDVAGKLIINKRVVIYYTFPEKGKWYFFSSPFDVYLKGIDNRFQLKNELFTGAGNYFYVQTYNGQKRASTEKSTGNWEVFTPPVSLDNPLIFEKGKGYLIALDADASESTLLFSAENENIPEDFGKTTTIPVKVTSLSGTDTDYNGWYLCGNPLPAPLNLTQIAPDPALDGNIYLYDGEKYKPYAIGSDYALPPLTAFFVKATAPTELLISSKPSTANSTLLKSHFPLNLKMPEPMDIPTQLSSAKKEDVYSLLKGNTLCLYNLPSAGSVQVMDVAGRLVYSCSTPSGSSVCPLSLRSGLYVVLVEAGGYRAQHKCVLSQ